MNGKVEEWQRPKTTRRYLHPPMSERFYTLWREGKIILGENEIAVRGEYYNLISSGIWFLHGEKQEMFDFRSAEVIQRQDGIPVHGLKFSLGELDVYIEAFSDFKKKPRCYIELRVENNGSTEVYEELAFMLKTGKEADLIFSAPDIYASYSPNVDAWHKLKSTWYVLGDVFTDGERQIKIKGDIEFSLCESTGVASSKIALSAGEVRRARFVFDIGSSFDFDYNEARLQTVEAWNNELLKVNKLPNSILSNLENTRTIKNLTVQMLQCFCRPKNSDIVLARQGGLQRQIWTYESMPVLEALSRIGDFGDYIEPVIDTYFNDFYNDSGEITPLAIPWAMATANALQSFGDYAVRLGDADFFKRYADRAYKSFLWIKRNRVTPEEARDRNLVSGLFPPMRSCDDELVFQSWTNTDTFNIRGLSALLDAFSVFNDARSDEIKTELDDYLRVMHSEWNKIVEKQPTGFLEVPFSPSISDKEVKTSFAFSVPVAFLVEGIDISVNDANRIIATYTEKKMIKDGLYDRMPDYTNDEAAKYNLDENGNCLVWYVCGQEYYWFKYFLLHGMRERCYEILDANKKYAMTDEYYMQERYNQRDPYFNPWSPNASANGRTVNMILDYYG